MSLRVHIKFYPKKVTGLLRPPDQNSSPSRPVWYVPPPFLAQRPGFTVFFGD